MEQRRNTTAGVLYWTPAPFCESPTSTDYEDEEEAEMEDDFASQMDENGIIGLSEALEDIGLRESWCGGEAEFNPAASSGHRTPEDVEPSGCEGERSPEEQSHNLTGHLVSEIAEGAHVLSSDVEPAAVSNRPVSLSASAFSHFLPFSDKELGIEAQTFPKMGFTDSLPDSHCSQSSVRSSPRFPEIELKASLQPLATFSEQGASDDCNRVSKASPEPNKLCKQPVPLPRKTRKPSPEATLKEHPLIPVRINSSKPKQQSTSHDREPRTQKARNDATEVYEFRHEPLSYRIPDFSKVEHKVHFPKGGYKPPKSKISLTRTSLSPEPPLMFKSPADIVKEVLLNPDDGPFDPSDCDRSPSSAPRSTVPQEFRCPREATTLLYQLQEEFNSLLTKHAEARNTIDRLRLEAKVNLYSDPPKPGHFAQWGLNSGISKLIKLDFPQSQRAEFNSASLCANGNSTQQGSSAAHSLPRSTGPQLEQQLTNILINQTERFLQQMQTFEDLLKSGKLKPFQQEEGLSELTQGLKSLERGYLLTKDDYKLLQQQGVEISDFDPERELDELIFQCGTRMEELEEQVAQMRREQPTCEAPPSPPPQPNSSCAPSDGEETLTPPQSPPVPLLVDPGEAADVEVSSASDEEEDEQTLSSLYLNPQNGKHRCDEHDFAMQLHHYQSFKELPTVLDQNLRGRLPLSAESETGKDKVQETPQRKIQSNHPPSSKGKVEVGKSHSSSLSSLGEVPASEKRSSKTQAGTRIVLSQDGIISPETDSGFIGSESSHLTPLAASSPLHQRAPESCLGPPEENTGRTQTGPFCASPPFSSPSLSPMTEEPIMGSQRSPDHSRRTRRGYRRRTFSCSPQHWTDHREQTSGAAYTGSESEQSDHLTKSIDSRHSSYLSSTSVSHAHHGDSLGARRPSQVAGYKDAIQSVQTEVTRLKEKVESCLANKETRGAVRAAPPVQETFSHREQPRLRSGSGGRRETRAVDEVEEDLIMRRTTRKRTASARKHKPQRDTLTRSSSTQHKPQVSRFTQTSTTSGSYCSQAATVRSRRTQTRQNPAASQTADEPDSRRSQTPLCPQCRFERPGGGNNEQTHSSTHCPLCHLCGHLKPHRCTQEDCRRLLDSPTHIHLQPAKSPSKAAGSRYVAAAPPPALLQYVPVCPSQLLLYPSTLYNNNTPGTSSGVRGHKEERGRTRRTPSVDMHRSMDHSLDRAIRAARHMKHTTRHMAHSLSSGVQYQEMLTQSCSY
ncbi:AT-hook-containing transcription factor [Parambassis ranga]|uniref:AT-hook-containing transcription factor n=1 Tax=Parambassis ranga TaxID=210632 RepID=A0A6P7JCC3_9TELE|nr:AT-hook-containing transcription factor [Parambassis ranga]XP_028274469.1 AT-hook-containing transcription factor [Parambassis ranga]